MTLRPLLAILAATALSGCASFPNPFAQTSSPAPQAEVATPTVAIDPEVEVAVEAVSEPDLVTPPAPEPAPTGPSGPLGSATVSLGDPSDPGLWVKSDLVTADTPGRVVTDTGRTLALTLRPLPPGSDAGAQISLAALQELGLPITGLAPLTLIATP